MINPFDLIQSSCYLELYELLKADVHIEYEQQLPEIAQALCNEAHELGEQWQGIVEFEGTNQALRRIALVWACIGVVEYRILHSVAV